MPSEESETKRSEGCWWKRRTLLEKILLVLLLIIFLFLLVLIILLALGIFSFKPQEDDVCTSYGCVQAAASVYNNIDFSVDPCDNFYNYACGNWRKTHVIPEHRTYLARFSVLREEVQVTLKYLLEGESLPGEPKAVQYARKMYKSCINITNIEERNLSAAIDLLDSFGGWPALDDRPGGYWNEDSFDLSLLLSKLMLYYNNPLIGFYVSVDSKNSSARMIFADQPGLNMPGRSFFLKGRNDEKLLAYENLVKSVLLDFGADPVTVDEDVNDQIEFEIALANITIPSNWRRNSEDLYNKYTVGELATTFPEPTKFKFVWKEYINNVFGMENINMHIQDDEPIIVEEPRYFDKLFVTLEQFSKRTVANYVIWSIMQNRIVNLPSRFDNMMTEYNKVLTGRVGSGPRWQKCTSYVNNNFGTAVGRLYVEEKFDEEAKSDMNLMIDGIQKAYGELLEELTWMDDYTKTLAKEKANYMQRKIGYDDFVLNDTVLDAGYQNYSMTEDNYFENILKLLNLWVSGDFKKLRQPVNKDIWTSAPATVNAYYSSPYNRIMFPAGILQPPYYHRDQPRSLNYGGIGSLIGHEITHGFDNRGRQYDKFGNLNQWWGDEVIEKFINNSECFIKQYDKYSYPEAGGKLMNGYQTLGENIADNGGLKQAFRGYRAWVASMGKEEPSLPSLNLTHSQLFFVNFAQIRCSNHRKADAIHHILTGQHSPPRFRVIGTLQNMKEFADTYNCPKGSYMNPEHKCRLW
ncbi:neprilysin-like [Mizuhopecten yessoensis]|uniref:Membrane metallo-endopeptidase-like 1 n=1 Tax=Mizuhopecten yessoensis TaxID=6573 RepID=A0A210R2P6_MIZYE|nr:neprilysin-like [Mizuhopecten yessoensis]OWF55370.1 Membrane metallo-endopeptidase-like 1 [Mizuhopecten yessoensis]